MKKSCNKTIYLYCQKLYRKCQKTVKKIILNVRKFNQMLSDSSYVSESSEEDIEMSFSPKNKQTNKVVVEQPFIPEEITDERCLTFASINSILQQRDAFLKRQRSEIERVWGENFNPFPALDKISTRIALNQVKEVSTLLEKVCDNFIDSIVHSEFNP